MSFASANNSFTKGVSKYAFAMPTVCEPCPGNKSIVSQDAAPVGILIELVVATGVVDATDGVDATGAVDVFGVTSGCVVTSGTTGDTYACFASTP